MLFLSRSSKICSLNLLITRRKTKRKRKKRVHGCTFEVPCLTMRAEQGLVYCEGDLFINTL